jgi:cell division control protein 6
LSLQTEQQQNHDDTNDELIFIASMRREDMIEISTEDESDSSIYALDRRTTSLNGQENAVDRIDRLSGLESFSQSDRPKMTGNSKDRESVIELSSASDDEYINRLSSPRDRKARSSRRRSRPQLPVQYDFGSESEYEDYTSKNRRRPTTKASKRRKSISKLGSVTPKRRLVTLDEFSIIMRRTPTKSCTPSRKKSTVFTLDTTPTKTAVELSESPSKLYRQVSTATNNNSIYTRAKALFQRGSQQRDIIGREVERKTITEFLSSRLAKGHGALYLSGLPGTGKSALLSEVLAKCVANVQGMDSEYSINVADINCVTVGAASNVFVKIHEAFSSKDNLHVNESDTGANEEVLFFGIRRQIIDDLEKRFLGSLSSNTRYVLVLDELDHILTRDQEVLRLLFQWACTPESRLVLVGIANALDLTNRLLPRLRRAGLVPQFLSFKPYEAPDIIRVLEARLWTLVEHENKSSPAETHDKTAAQKPKLPPLIHPAAIQLCARRVAANTGDLRKAFDICCRAIELAEAEQAVVQPSNTTSNGTISTTDSHDKKQNSALASSGSLLKSSLLSSHSLDTNSMSNSNSQTENQISKHAVSRTPHVSISHVAKACSSLFYLNSAHRIQSLNLHQKAVLCVLVMLEQHPHLRQSQTPKQQRAIANTNLFSRSSSSNDFTSMPVTVADVYERYTSLCHRSQAVAALPFTDFLDVVSVLETHGLVTTLLDSPRKRKRALLVGVGFGAATTSRGGFNPGSPTAGKNTMAATGFARGFESDIGQRRLKSQVKQTDLVPAVAYIPLLKIFLDEN